MLGRAVDLLWKRTCAGQDTFKRKRAQEEFTDFINRHSRLLECIRHLFEQNNERVISCLKLSPGQCSALMYLMASSSSDAERYRNADPPSEKQLNWDNWDKACKFWMLLANDGQALQPVRNALAALANEEGESPALSESRQPQRIAIICKGWARFVQGHVLTEEEVSLEFASDGDGHTRLAESPTVGGIDFGDPHEVEPAIKIGAGKAKAATATPLRS